jgi:hypothetical protein
MSAEPNRPTCTKAELLSVACPICGAAAGEYCCWVTRGGQHRILLLPQHHEARFWRAKGQDGGVH